MRNQHWQNWDERRWSYQPIGYRRGGGYRRRQWRSRPRRRPEAHYAAILGAFALIGAFTVGGAFLLLVNGLVAK
jgi:hypothetical protein